MTTEELNLLIDQLGKLAPAAASAEPHVRALAHRALRGLAAEHEVPPQEINQWLARIAHERGQTQVPVSPERLEELRRQKQVEIETVGPKLWDEILLRAVRWNGGDETAFLDSIAQRLPCGECQVNFQRYRTENPPRFDRADFDFFGWAMTKLNAIREKKGKPVWNVAESRAFFLAK